MKQHTSASYMEKADRAVQGAKGSLTLGDLEGACSRAYYAMFDAAHAALMAEGIETATDEIKTHSGLLSVFSRELVKTGKIEIDLFKSLNQVQQLRLLADYNAEPPELERTKWAVEQAGIFVAAMREKFAITSDPRDN